MMHLMKNVTCKIEQLLTGYKARARTWQIFFQLGTGKSRKVQWVSCHWWWVFYELCLISWPSIRDWRYADTVKTMNCQQININRSNLHYFNLVSIQFIPISCLWLKPQTKERDNFIFSICWMYMFRLSHIFACKNILICTVYKSLYNWLDS